MIVHDNPWVMFQILVASHEIKKTNSPPFWFDDTPVLPICWERQQYLPLYRWTTGMCCLHIPTWHHLFDWLSHIFLETSWWHIHMFANDIHVMDGEISEFLNEQLKKNPNVKLLSAKLDWIVYLSTSYSCLKKIKKLHYGAPNLLLLVCTPHSLYSSLSLP